jgi:hypothetical protein
LVRRLTKADEVFWFRRPTKGDEVYEGVEISKGCPILEYDDGVVDVRVIQELMM